MPDARLAKNMRVMGPPHEQRTRYVTNVWYMYVIKRVDFLKCRL